MELSTESCSDTARLQEKVKENREGTAKVWQRKGGMERAPLAESKALAQATLKNQDHCISASSLASLLEKAQTRTVSISNAYTSLTRPPLAVRLRPLRLSPPPSLSIASFHNKDLKISCPEFTFAPLQPFMSQ